MHTFLFQNAILSTSSISPSQFGHPLVVRFWVVRWGRARAVANAWQGAHLRGLNGGGKCFAVLVAKHRVLVVEPAALHCRVHLGYRQEGRNERKKRVGLGCIEPNKNQGFLDDVEERMIHRPQE